MTSIRDILKHRYGDRLVFMEPGRLFDQAIVGVSDNHDVVYSKTGAVAALMVEQGMSEYLAEEELTYRYTPTTGVTFVEG